MIIYTKLLFWADGFTVTKNLLLIHPRARGSIGLLRHEQVHQKQMAQDGWGRFVLRYLFSSRWRLLYEVEAYRVSIFHGMPPSVAADLICANYFVKAPKSAVLELLSS